MNVFEKLNAINVNDKTEIKDDGKNKLTYLSWAWAWAEVKKAYPDAQYEIKKFENNLPYVYDEKTGYMVFTSVTIEGITHEMWLPVMDGTNKAMKSEPYNYKVKEYKWQNGKNQFTGNYIDKTINAATMFDINKTIMRCLTKNLGMFGLGLYIYAGEDLPETEQDKTKPEQPKEEFSVDAAIFEIREINDMPTLVKFFNNNQSKFNGNAVILAEFKKQKEKILKAQSNANIQ